MALRFRHKYRIESTRLKGYDYSRDGAYFVTICTKNKIQLFGEISSPKIKLSDIGQIVTDCWHNLQNHYPNIILDEFIVMPDHIHGIIIIRNGPDNKFKHGLSEFIRAFKSFSSRRINELNMTISGIWQSRYYDRIIRSNNELNRIRLYIKNNPNRLH
jgi:putative transposase